MQQASALLRDLRRGTVVFMQPPGPATCAGASQKPMYLACDYWRATGVLRDIRVVMVVPDPTVSGIPRDRSGAGAQDRRVRHRAADADRAARGRCRWPGRHARATGGGRAERIPYDVLARRASAVGAGLAQGRSRLAASDDPLGFVEVDTRTLRHARYDECLGDSGMPRRRRTRSPAARCASRRSRSPRTSRRCCEGEPDERLRGLRGVPVHGLALDRRLRGVRRPVPPQPTIPSAKTLTASAGSRGCSIATSCRGSTGTSS